MFHRHEHAHGADEAHHHSAHGTQGARDFSRAFAVGILLNLAFVGVETVYGVLADSMSLLADASHNLSDVLALALAWGASVLSRREPSQRFTYGLRGSSILAALFNATLLLLVTGAIAWESIQRLLEPVSIASTTVIWVALAGIAVNGASALLFAKGRERDLNARGAFLHLVADAAVSLGVVIAGSVIYYTGWLWLDPMTGLLIAAAIVAGTWRVLRESLTLALAAVPDHIDPDIVRAYLSGLRGVAEVHDLHIWAMSTTETALTAHLVIPGGHPGDAFMSEVSAELGQRYRVQHATIQIETGDRQHPCALAPDHVV